MKELKKNFFRFCFPLRAERCAENEVGLKIAEFRTLNTVNRTGIANFKILNPLHIRRIFLGKESNSVIYLNFFIYLLVVQIISALAHFIIHLSFSSFPEV